MQPRKQVPKECVSENPKDLYKFLLSLTLRRVIFILVDVLVLYVFFIYLLSHIIKYAFHKLSLLLYKDGVEQLKLYRMYMQVRDYMKK